MPSRTVREGIPDGRIRRQDETRGSRESLGISKRHCIGIECIPRERRPIRGGLYYPKTIHEYLSCRVTGIIPIIARRESGNRVRYRRIEIVGIEEDIVSADIEEKDIARPVSLKSHGDIGVRGKITALRIEGSRVIPKTRVGTIISRVRAIMSILHETRGCYVRAIQIHIESTSRTNARGALTAKLELIHTANVRGGCCGSGTINEIFHSTRRDDVAMSRL